MSKKGQIGFHLQPVEIRETQQIIQDGEFGWDKNSSGFNNTNTDNSTEAGIDTELVNHQLLGLNRIMLCASHRSWDMQDYVQLSSYVRSTGKPNIYSAQVTLPTRFNLPLMYSLASSTSDRETVGFLRYGWSLNHDGSPVTMCLKNHTSALQYPVQMTEYIIKEMSLDSLLGPFLTSPWKGLVACSPMSTTEKKLSDRRRVIVDLSWPRNGRAVNNGISKDFYLGQPMNLTYPTVDRLCKRAATLGEKARGYKIDLDRAFKQIWMCPADWPLLGITWMKLLFFDKTAVMGARSCPYICQRTTSFVRHVMENLSYFLANYVDDFMGLELEHKIWQSFYTLRNLLRDLHITEAEEKAVEPTDELEFLGVGFKLSKGIIFVTEKKLQDIKDTIADWMHQKVFYTRTELESLLGRLQFVSSCVRPGRVMVLRLREQLKNSNAKNMYEVTEQMKLDLHWWNRYIHEYDNISYMWMKEISEPDALIATDASLNGLGGKCNQEVFTINIPDAWREYNGYVIHHLEMLAVIVALKKWSRYLEGKRFTMLCDNTAVIDIITSGKSSDVILQRMLRMFMYITCMGKFEVVMKYIPSEENEIPDKLSRVQQAGGRLNLENLLKQGYKLIEVTQEDLILNEEW